MSFSQKINFIFSLGHVAKDKSFYASLHAEPISQDQDASVYTAFSLQDQGSLQTEQTKGITNSEYRFVNLLSYYIYHITITFS
jgi:hypothetical protein